MPGAAKYYNVRTAVLKVPMVEKWFGTDLELMFAAVRISSECVSLKSVMQKRTYAGKWTVEQRKRRVLHPMVQAECTTPVFQKPWLYLALHRQKQPTATLIVNAI